MEKLVTSGNFFRGKRVWLSGHTGFKGGWLAIWLTGMGARVTGYSLPPRTRFFEQLQLKNRLRHEIGDLGDFARVRKSILQCRPDFVFHLAAQAIVRDSYVHPLKTYEVNTFGVAHVLEALRDLRHPCAAVFVTTDKVYRNEDRRHAFREQDPLGGQDPYSASKAAAEILINSYRDSFFRSHPVRISSARSGNVIGGGDYSIDRIVPDAFRSLRRGQPISVRNPRSIRPWQHVLEPTTGYLSLAVHLSSDQKTGQAYNFGPAPRNQKTVSALVRQILKNWPGRWRHVIEKNPPHEAKRLQLHNDKALDHLGWRPRLSFPRTVQLTIDWYRDSIRPDFKAYEVCLNQIREYQKLIHL
jgi:CDP-glucose 4,6-dehydratase